MAVVISSVLFTKKDVAGNPWTEAWAVIEFRDANYSPGGENLALANEFSRIEYILVTPLSGNNNYRPETNMGDYPTNGGSGRLQLYYMASGSVALNVSGLPIQILSGTTLTLASGNTASGPFSGRIGIAASGNLAVGLLPVEILSGTAVSGTRALIHALGH